MKTYFKSAGLVLLITLANLVLITPSYAQDIDELTERYRVQLQKIQSSEDSQEFFMTHIKDDFGLTNSLMGFLNGLENGAYSRQIEYVMRVPVQRWNPNAGAGGWGRWDRDYAVRVVNKNVSGTLSNVTSLMSQIGDAMAIYSIGNDIVQAFYGDDKAKLTALHGTYSFVAGKLTSDFPGMSTAMLGVAFVSYALNKFITTTLGEYSDYWWQKYRNYYLNQYPSFVEEWAPLATQEGGFDIIERRLEEEFWISDEAILEADDAPTLYSQAEYAKNVMGAGFAAQYYRDYLQRNMESWVRTRTEQGLLDVWSEYRNDSREIQEIVQELETLQELIQFAEREMNQQTPERLTISPEQATVRIGETVNFLATAVFQEGSTTNITDLEETNWSAGSSTFTAAETGDYEVTVTYRGISAEAVITVQESMPVSLTIVPGNVSLNPGENISFTALAIFEDGSTTDITASESTNWSSGGSSFTADEPGEFTLNVSYMGLSTEAIVTVNEEATQCNQPSETFDEESGACVCNTAEGYAQNEELGRCINIDEALEDVTEIEDGGAELCDEEALAASLARLDELTASGNRLAAEFQSMLNSFLKEINNQNSTQCQNNIISYTYASAKDMQAEYQAMADEAGSLSTELMIEGAICPLEELNLEVTNILKKISQLGEPQGQIDEGVATMENELQSYGCDLQEVSDLGDTIADRSTTPEVIQSGGVGPVGNVGEPGPGPGPGGPGSFGGTLGVVHAVYSGSVFPGNSLSIRVRLNTSNVNFSLSPGNFDYEVLEGISLQEGNNVQITIPGTGLNASINLIESDFIWFDPNTQTHTEPGNGNRIFSITIAVYYDDDEEEMRYRMQVIIGAGGFGYPGSPSGGRTLQY